MKKRLFAAFLMVGAISAVMVMSASAFWTTGQATVQVNATAGKASLNLGEGCDIGPNQNCWGQEVIDAVVPGWSRTTETTVTNTGDVDLELIYSVSGVDSALDQALFMSITCGSTTKAGPLSAWEGEVSLGSVGKTGSVVCQGTLSLPADAGNHLQGQTASFQLNIYGKSN